MTTCVAARRRRGGFTLIEIIVVLTIIAFLAGLAILIIPNLNDAQRAPRGAFSLQQWLLAAKNRATRDGAARGIRLSWTGTQDVKTGVITYDPVTTAQYIEQPDDYIVAPGVQRDPYDPTTPDPNPANSPQKRPLPFRRLATFVDPTKGVQLNQVVLEGSDAVAQANPPVPDFSGGNTSQTLWPVQVGDYLEVNGGLPHMITAVGPSDPVNNPKVIDLLTLASPLPVQIAASNPVAAYRIIRTPRVAGDEQLQMPDDIGIDLNTNAVNGLSLPMTITFTGPVNASNNTQPVAGTIDILFSPQGAVVGRGTASDALYLWVRDTTLNLGEGDNTLVVVYTRSGAVAAYPVNNNPGQDPYSFAKTGRASGL